MVRAGGYAAIPRAPMVSLSHPTATAPAISVLADRVPGEPRRVGLLYALPAVALFMVFQPALFIDGIYISSCSSGMGRAQRTGQGLGYSAIFTDPTVRRHSRTRSS